MALSFSTTIVVFSPSARGSRSLLERMHDFVRLLGAEKRVLSYNQENLRVRALDGGVSLLRSFPSKIEVRSPPQTQDTRPNTHTFERRRIKKRRQVRRPCLLCSASSHMCKKLPATPHFAIGSGASPLSLRS